LNAHDLRLAPGEIATGLPNELLLLTGAWESSI
jgi:hypothetical protein